MALPPCFPGCGVDPLGLPRGFRWLPVASAVLLTLARRLLVLLLCLLYLASVALAVLLLLVLFITPGAMTRFAVNIAIAELTLLAAQTALLAGVVLLC